MKKKIAFSSKMHLFIIISCVIVAIGLAVGLVCHFCADGFYNWGGDYMSYQSVTVTYYEKIDGLSTEEVEDICEDAFDANGVRYYMVTYSDVNDGNEIEYRFVTSADSEAVKAAKETINTQINSLYILGGAQYTPYEAVLGGGNTLMYVGIALASVVAFQFLYFLIRYKLTMALAAFIADVHNLALFLSLLAITRVQVSSFVFALSVMVVILTMICCAILFDRMRKNFKTDEYKAMPSFEQSDAAANECLSLITTLNIALVAIIAIILVFATIGALSVYSLFMPCVAAILAVLVCEYGTMFFIPSVYSRLKLKADIHAENKAKKVKPEKSKKKDKPASADGALAK